MNFRTQGIGFLAGLALLAGWVGLTHAACPGAATQSAAYCLYQPGFSTVGGNVQSASQQLLASNMYPYQTRSGASELTYWRNTALAGLSAGQAYRNSLLLIGVNPTAGSPLARLLKDPKNNYETVGLLGSFAAKEAALIQARDTFTYQLFINYPDAATAKLNLLDTVKTLANLHLMVADEYLVDALEWRFPTGTVGTDPMLDKQIELLGKAQAYYEKAVAAFVSGFSPAVGTNIYIADVFDPATYSLFNLAVERLSLTLREKSSKQLVRQMAPDPAEQWNAAWAQAGETLKSANVSAYLTTAAIAAKRGAAFDDVGAGSSLVGALNSLRKQGNIHNQRLNPLGYDNRYVPALDFENLYSLANGYLNAAVEAKSQFDSEKRLFDANYESLQSQLSAQRTQYIANLSSFTGCAIPANPDDDSQRQAFLICAGEAGGDLFNCGLDMTVDAFNACINSGKTRGSLALKYRNLLDAQLGLNAARLRRDNILQRVDYENEKAGRLIEIKKNETDAHIIKLDEYLPKLKSARTITDTVTTVTPRRWSGGKWVKDKKTRNHETSESFKLSVPELDLQTDKEKDVLRLSADFQIQQ